MGGKAENNYTCSQKEKHLRRKLFFEDLEDSVGENSPTNTILVSLEAHTIGGDTSGS